MEIAKLFKKQTKMANTNLNKAKKEKNDEFYTQLPDIEKELGHYKKHLKIRLFFVTAMTRKKVIFGIILR